MDQWYRSVISGERAGAWSAILRFGLEVMSWGYGIAIGIRNLLYDAGIMKEHKLLGKDGRGVPVISVGNITTGGTGKTPTVIMLVKELQRQGRRPAVLTRGYGAPRLPDGSRGKSDEVMVIEQECPGVPVVVRGDRVAGGREAIDKFNADVLVIDDGFQHRRLARDLNIVLVDATEPMGIPGLLPRGTWREPPYNLKRATMIMLTRCEQVSAELADLAAGLLTQWVSPRSIFQQRTAVMGLYDGTGNPVPLVAGANGPEGGDWSAGGRGAGPVGSGGAGAGGGGAGGGRRVVAFAGIGNPQGFLHTVQSLGLQVVAGAWFDDHHGYRVPQDFAALARATSSRGIDAWVTTLKDWVKLRGLPLPPDWPPIWHVRIEARVAVHEQEFLRSRLATLPTGGQEHASPAGRAFGAPGTGGT